MRLLRLILFPVLLVSVVGHVYAAPFALFPKAGHLASPDGRFEVRDVDLREPGSEFSGIFHSLWLVETATGRSRKLCDYVGVAAVAWSEKDSLMVTQYLSKKTSRALRENDHAFVEASRLEGEIFHFQVWGYGQHDRNGFHWNCEYKLGAANLKCEAKKSAAQTAR